MLDTSHLAQQTTAAAAAAAASLQVRQQAGEDLRVCHIACGWDHSLAVTRTGTLYTWGAGQYGKLGHGDEVVDFFVPFAPPTRPPTHSDLDPRFW